MKRRFLIPGHPEVVILAKRAYAGSNGMVTFFNGSTESFLYDDEESPEGFQIVAQFCGGVLILPEEVS